MKSTRSYGLQSTFPEISGWRPSRDSIGWLALALSAVILPHSLRVPLWLTGCYAALVCWRLAHELRGFPRPGRLLRGLVTVGVPVGVVLSYGTVLGRDAGVALLVALAGMKLLETDSLRDAYVVVLLACFLVVTNFLFSQSIATGVYMLVVVVLILAALISVNDRAGSLGPRARVRLAAALIAQALPVMLLLFFLFPRMPGPLWGLPKDAHAGITKLGDKMSPGNISELSLSDAVAFRVEFDGAAPRPSALYWRGPVLWRTDGREWSTLAPSRGGSDPPAAGLRYEGEPTDYEITLQPHYERWLFALDMPAEIPDGSTISDDYQLLHARPVRGLRKYRVRSFLRYGTGALDPADRAAALELPVGFHPRSRGLARSWRAEAGTGPDADRAIVARGLAFFREQPFYYTLRPPLLRGDTIDEFLFITRRGFCEFYAAAFTVLMRAAGIPTRVVTGYQGGEYNDIGGYYIVRQRDAHAWVETWSADRGWTRVDPTAAVAPERIERGVDAALPPTLGPEALGLQASDEVQRLYRRLRHGWDAVNNRWNQWVIDYGAGRQQRLLGRLGIDAGNWRAIGLWLIAGLGLVLAAVAGWLARQPRLGDRARRAYQRFCRKLARRGLPRPEHEGPRDYAARVIHSRPDLATEVERITGFYLGARYAPPGPAVGPSLTELERAVGRFKP